MKLKDTPWKESYDQPRQHMEKQRHYFANNGPSSQGSGFSSGHVWMWDWTVKKAEHQRIDALELWCWRRLLRVPWTARRSNQSILMEINPGISLEGMMLKLKLQYFGHLLWRVDSMENLWCRERLGAGAKGDNSEWDCLMASLTRWTWFCWTLGAGDGQGGPACCDSWGRKESDTNE